MIQFLGNILGEIGTRPRKTRYPGTSRKVTPIVMRPLDLLLARYEGDPSQDKFCAVTVRDPLPITQGAGTDSQIKGDA